MSDQSYMRSVSNSNRTPSGLARLETGGGKNGAITNRFRRGGTKQAPGREGQAQVPGSGRARSDRDLAELLRPLESTARVPRPRRPVIARSDAWDLLPQVSPGARRQFLSGAPLITLFRSDPAKRAFDLLRTRLLQTLRKNGWNRVAVASPVRGCGATFTSVNLAQSLARIPGSRTVLMDLNQRSPGVGPMLDIDDGGDMRGFLAGETPVETHLRRASKTLALGLADKAGTGTAEMLHDARCGVALRRMITSLRPDVVLYDLPPVLEHDDLAAFLPRVDGVLLVVDGTRTLAREIAACERILDGQTQLLGIILNRARNCGGD